MANTGNTRRYHTTAQIQLGTLYAQVGDYVMARRYLLDAQQAAAHYDYPDRTNRALGELGEICRQQRQWTAVRAYFARSIAISRQIGEVPYALSKQLSLAHLHEDEGQYPAAAAEGLQVLAQAQAANLPLLVPLVQALLARVALRTGQVGAAIAYGRQSLAGSQQARLLAGTEEASAVLAEAYARQRAYAPALAALRQYNAAHDSLTGDNTRRRAALLQFGHERQQQVAQIRLLTQQNRLQAQGRELERVRGQRTLIGLAGLLLLAGGLGGGLFWQYRRRAAQRLTTRDAALRQRLAAELHYDVGSLLTQISLQSDLLREAPAAPEATLARLERLSDTSRRAARQMANVVWGLHASAAELPDVLTHMRDHAHEVLMPQELVIDFAVSEDAAALRPGLATCQTLYFIFKEALHNVVKHARGTTLVAIRVRFEAGQLCLSVRDNAPGPAPTARPGGHGLASMRHRAAAVGGAIHYVAEATDFGVVTCLPAGVAAARRASGLVARGRGGTCPARTLASPARFWSTTGGGTPRPYLVQNICPLRSRAPAGIWRRRPFFGALMALLPLLLLPVPCVFFPSPSSCSPCPPWPSARCPCRAIFSRCLREAPAPKPACPAPATGRIPPTTTWP